MLICDTSGLLALFDAGDAHNAHVTEAVEADAGPFIVSPYVIAELDDPGRRFNVIPVDA